MIPNEVYYLWLYLKDGVQSFGQVLPRLERDLAVRVTILFFCQVAIVIALVLIGRLTIIIIIVTPLEYLI